MSPDYDFFFREIEKCSVKLIVCENYGKSFLKLCLKNSVKLTFSFNKIWNFSNFSAIKILREINFSDSEV